MSNFRISIRFELLEKNNIFWVMNIFIFIFGGFNAKIDYFCSHFRHGMRIYLGYGKISNIFALCLISLIFLVGWVGDVNNQ